MSCHIMSCHVMSCHVMSCHVISCHVMSCHVMSCHVTSCHVMSSHVFSRLVTSCHVMSCHVMSCHVTSRLVMSCHLTSSHVFSRLVMSCHVMSCHLTSSHVLSRLVISCHLARESCSRIFLPSLENSSIMAAGWPRRGFRNRDPVRESGSERRSRCGAACTASVCVWHRAHFWDLGIVLRGRLRASGVLRACACGSVHIFATWASFCVAGCGDRACCEHAAGVLARVPRRCAVGIGFRACFVHAWPTCVSRGRLRESCVLGVCWERAGGPCRRRRAVGIGFGVCRARAHDFTRCDLRFAWQAWDSGFIAMMRSGRHWTVDPRGRRKESCAVAKIAGFRGPVRQIACAGARWASRNRGRRRESVVCGCELGADVSWNAAAGCVGRVARSALSRGTQWQAVTMGVGRVARVVRAALCHGDCCWACRVGGAVPWGLLLGVSRGCRCAMGIAAGRVAWVSLCDGDCWWACRVGGAVPCGLLLGVSRGCRCAMGIAGRPVLSVAPCLEDC